MRFTKSIVFRIALLGCLVTLAALGQTVPAVSRDGAAGGHPTGRFRGIASAKVFSGVNRNDARAALKIWFDMLARQRGYGLDSTIDIFDTVAEIRERLRSRTVELVMLSARDYLELETSNLVLPVLTDSRTTGGALYSYLLLVNPSTAVTTVTGLRGRNVLVSARGTGETGTAWLEVLLGRDKLPHAASFFNTVKAVAKPQACILPVFFGTADACIVDEVNLKLAQEMNPQLGKLTILVRSHPMLESVIGVPADAHPYQKELIESMLSLHDDQQGRQLLMIFKTDRLVPIQPADLESARDLWRDYDRMPGRPASTQPAGSDSPSRVPGGH